MATTPHDARDRGMIRVHDAHLRNLRHVDVELPRDCTVAVTGVSGSGKSSLAFGTLHGEAQRRYMESVAPFARHLIGSAVNPQVASVEGLPPTVALEQNRTAAGPRPTVGTVSTLSNTLRVLFSRCGTYPDRVRAAHGGRLDSDAFSPNTAAGMCPDCQGTGVVHEPTEETMVPDPSLSVDEGAIAAWPGAWLGKNFHDILVELGYPVDVPWRDIPEEDRRWILFTDEQPVVTVHPRRGAHQIQRTYEGTWRSVAVYLRQTLAETSSDTTRRRVLSFMSHSPCPTCGGRRLTADALAVTYLGLPVDEMAALPLSDLLTRCAERRDGITGATAAADEAERLLLDEFVPTCRSVVELGLGHLTLDRPATTLSAGEHQRLRLSSQPRSGLFGVAYVLDEPSAGLHPVERRAVRRLVETFVAGGNSVLLVEHDMELVAGADWVVDVGPRAGADGGRVLWSGSVDGLRETAVADPGAASPTARALAAGPLTLRATPRTPSSLVRVRGARARTVRDLDLDLGLGTFTAVTGLSGTGKTTLASVVLPAVLEGRHVPGDGASGGGTDGGAAGGADGVPVSATSVSGAEAVDRVVRITQTPIGRTRRSCLATYTGLFDRVRRLFADTDDARERGWGVSRFSFNTAQGRCPTCNGEGRIEVELVFLPGSSTVCPDCHGARYTAETLEVRWNGLTVADVLDLTVVDAEDVFAGVPAVARTLRALDAVGLGYLRLGQGSPELSGGEAQRIKLATELQRTQRGQSVYVLDEPTTGLHPADVELLTRELHRLVDAGNTVVVVEHDMTVVAGADRVLEMGPGAGDAGGRVIADGTPAEVARTDTPTGTVLRARSTAG
ncbi:excinuclease ABC subunit A [Corynebacterium bovis]|uniref:excinuclease ABC subunit A n=1 Tax=Corynebacterium bovis TaxID=36808 RepID=UPI003CC6FD54